MEEHLSTSIMFDFFKETHDEWLESFCKYFGLEVKEVNSYFTSVNPDTLTPGKISRDLNINLTNYDSNQLSVVCRHMTTASNDDKDSFLVNGILNLKEMLQQKTPLSIFLEGYGISIDVEKSEMLVGQKSFPITSYGEPCDFCFKHRSEPCNEYFKCDPRKNMEHLGLKLYRYGATVEFFTHATLSQMERYSSIRRCPEILQTLDKIVSSINGYGTSAYKMSYDWMKEKKDCYILEFPVKLSDMETYAPIDYNQAWHDVSSCLEQSGYNYNDYNERKIPQNVLDNMIFLRWFISVYFYDSEELGSLLPGKCVIPENIKILEVNDTKR